MLLLRSMPQAGSEVVRWWGGETRNLTTPPPHHLAKACVILLTSNLLAVALAWPSRASAVRQRPDTLSPFAHQPPPRTCLAALRLIHPSPPLPRVSPAVLFRAPTPLRLVALTFDACEDLHPAGYDGEIIHILKQQGVPATLFLGGRWMWSHPGITRALAQARGAGGRPLFELANHSFLHPHLTRVSDERLREELALTQAIQYALTGHQGRWVRAPYGEYDGRVERIAAGLGLRLAQFDVVTGDPDPHISAGAIVRTVLRGVHPGSVVIMHVNGRGRHTAEALPRVIEGLRGEGYRFVTLSQLPLPRS